MPSSAPFVDPVTGELDTQQLLAEAFPLGKLIGVFVAVSLVPYGLGVVVGPSLLGQAFFLIGQFILAIGAGVVLLYVIVRGRELSES